MKLENTKTQMKRGVIEYCILSILSKKPQYSADIIDRMKDSKLIVVEGTLYPLLTRLKNEELLSYSWEESKQGPPRKYYKLTDKGGEFLAELKKEWTELVKSVNKLNK